MKIITTNPTGRRSNATARPRAYARAKAIEKALSKYVRLKCGHLASWDIDILYEVFRPLGPLKHYCETCRDWVEGIQKEKIEYPAEPLF